MLTTYLWIRLAWHDAYLKWDKEDYDNLEMINIPSDLVWKPDIVLYNKSVTKHRSQCTYNAAVCVSVRLMCPFLCMSV